MTPDQSRAVGRLGAEVTAGIVSWVHKMHRAIADRAFVGIGSGGTASTVGASTLWVRAVHDALASAVYATLLASSEAAGVIAGEVARRLVPESSPIGGDPLSNQAIAALNGFGGHCLVGNLAPLAIEMSVREEGRDVVSTPGGLRKAFPGATSKIAVFVHGLAETENAWWGGIPGALFERDRRGGGPPLVDQALGYTPVWTRYNTGIHISTNGKSLCRLMEDLVSHWPVPIDEVLLVGHSMGGLVIRSACHHGSVSDSRWLRLVRHVVYLGTPHLGAPLAKLAGAAGWIISRFPESKPLAPLVNGSSDGVKDLRFGYVLDEEWAGCDRDNCMRDHRKEVGILESASHLAVCATVSREPNSILAATVGDLLVLPGSAHGRRRKRQVIPFAQGSGCSVGRMNHLDLLDHPEVWERINSWLKSHYVSQEVTDQRAERSPK